MDSGDEVVPNPVVTFAIKLRVLDRLLDPRGTTLALYVCGPTSRRRNHTILARRQLVRAETQLCL